MLKISKSKWRYIPNILTVLRLVVIPVMAYFMILKEWVISLVIFVLAEITDVVDGYIARKFRATSNFGKLADPLADKLLQLTALLLLSTGGRIPMLFFNILCVKELAMIIGALFFLKKDVVVYSNWIGKAASAIIFAGIVLSFLNISVAEYLLWAGLAVSFTAGAFYLIRFLKQMKGKTE